MKSIRKPIKPRIRFYILERDKYTCQICGRKSPSVELEVDHIRQVFKGGTNDINNLRALCVDCNRGRNGHDLHKRSIIQKDNTNAEQLSFEKYTDELLWQQWTEKVDCGGILLSKHNIKSFLILLYRHLFNKYPKNVGMCKVWGGWKLELSNIALPDLFYRILEI